MSDAAEQFDLVIVGMGSGGIAAAEFAATIGLRTAVVERGRFGGDCLWTGCVPSKALIAAARAAHTMRHADALGLPAVTPDVDLGAVLRRIRAVQAEIASTDDDPARFDMMGVTVMAGTARVTGPNEVTVDGDRVLAARTILLCTGSRPAVPPIPGLEEAGFLTCETLWDAEPPRSIVMVGSGPVVVELAQALVRLGVAVTVLCTEASILPRDEPDLAALLAGIIERDGVRLHTGSHVTSVERNGDGVVVHARAGNEPVLATADAVFIGVGRVPNVDDLGLDSAGIDVGPEGIVVDDRGRTSVRSIYAAGDLAGRHLFTHSAGHEAVRAVRDAFFPGAGKVPSLVPWCTFTDPELAHAGLTVAEAEQRHGADVDVWRLDLARNDRARTDAANGAIVIVTAKGKVIGAHILAPAAGEMIHELALAIQQGLTMSDLAGLVHVYPTLASGVGQLAAEAAYEKAQKLSWLVGWRRIGDVLPPATGRR